MMMESKLCAALCALLLVINLGSAEHDQGHTAAANVSASGGDETAPGAPSAGPVPVSSTDTVTQPVTKPSPSGPDANSSAKVNSSLSSSATTEGQNVSATVETKKVNEAAGPEKNQTDQMTTPQTTTPQTATTPQTQTPQTTTPQATIPSRQTQGPISPTPLTSTTNTTTDSPASATPSTTTTPATNTSHPGRTPVPDSTAPSNASSTTVPTPEPAKSETNASTTTTTTRSTSTSSTSSTQVPLSNETLASLPPDEHLNTSTLAWQNSTVLPPSSPSARSESHGDSKNVINPTVVHNAPTLDPLLAGLVSAFIITAVIITLLLFLKLRRRDNRPVFHRLQDLPMDDMMEDTPLSMYSY